MPRPAQLSRSGPFPSPLCCRMGTKGQERLGEPSTLINRPGLHLCDGTGGQSLFSHCLDATVSGVTPDLHPRERRIRPTVSAAHLDQAGER